MEEVGLEGGKEEGEGGEGDGEGARARKTGGGVERGRERERGCSGDGAGCRCRRSEGGGRARMAGGWVWRSRVRNETILSSRGREAGDEGWGSSSALSVD